MPKFFITDSTTDAELAPPAGLSCGLDLTGRPEGYAYGGLADPFPDEMLIPRHEWQARIEEQEERGTHLQARSDRKGIPIKNQRNTNLCWSFGPVKAVELVRTLVHGLDYVSLSPASVAGPVNGYRNQGGWGRNALERLASHGAVPSEFWGDTDIDRRNATAENWTRALDYRVTEWWELEPRNIDQHISCLLRGFPVAVGLNYWRHEVCDIRALWLDGTIAVEFHNSWGLDWSEDGRAVRQGSRLLADDAVAPRVIVAA